VFSFGFRGNKQLPGPTFAFLGQENQPPRVVYAPKDLPLYPAGRCHPFADFPFLNPPGTSSFSVGGPRTHYNHSPTKPLPHPNPEMPPSNGNPYGLAFGHPQDFDKEVRKHGPENEGCVCQEKSQTPKKSSFFVAFFLNYKFRTVGANIRYFPGNSPSHYFYYYLTEATPS